MISRPRVALIVLSVIALALGGCAEDDATPPPATATPRVTATTFVASSTPTITPTTAATSTGTGTARDTATPTPTTVATETRTASFTPTATPSVTSTATPTPTTTPTSTSTSSLTSTATSTSTPSPPEEDLADELDNGADGRDPFGNPGHVPPIEACADELRASDASLVIRILPKGPLTPDGALAFTSGVCVYLPPGYVDSGLRYPVLYLLHGGGGDAGDWVTYGGIRSIMDGLISSDASNAAIVVMPDGTDAQWYDSIDGSLQNQAYLLDYIVPSVDRRFRTIAERSGRAIDGLSNGGYGSMHFAAKRPDRFVAAGAMSSNLAGLFFFGLGDQGTAPAYRHGSLPLDLAGNLDGVDLTLDIGTICVTDRNRDNCTAWSVEQIFVPPNRAFKAQLDVLRGPGDGAFEYRETEGGHSWNWWPLWLRERHLPFLLARLADPRPADAPAGPTEVRPAFRYRSIAQAFTVWGYEVSVEREVREFLDLSEVRATGLVVQGSGEAHIRTAALYPPGRSYDVAGAGGAAQHVVADAVGRISFGVDLGPAHADEQFSSAANALEAAGNYWVVRTIVISEE